MRRHYRSPSPRQNGDDLPIRQRFAGRFGQFRHISHTAFRIRHHPPSRSIAPPVAARERICSWLSGDMRLGQSPAPLGAVPSRWNRCPVRTCGIGADNPDCFNFSFRPGFELFQRRQTRFGRDAAHRHTPMAFNFVTVLRVLHTAIARQHMRQSARLPPAHRVGLARERERTATRFADLSCCQMQVMNCVVFVHTHRALIDPMLQSDMARSALPKIKAASTIRHSAMPQISCAMRGLYFLPALMSALNPLVCWATKPRSMRFSSSST